MNDGSDPYKPYPFLKECNENFQMHICKPFSPFWSVKYLNLGQKLRIRTTHHALLESTHFKVTKNPYYALSPMWSQKKVSAHGLFYFHVHDILVNLILTKDAKQSLIQLLH